LGSGWSPLAAIVALCIEDSLALTLAGARGASRSSILWHVINAYILQPIRARQFSPLIEA